jgi:predicted dehydrogenase
MSIKAAIIGFGFMGQTHAGNLLRIPGVEISGVVDLNSPVDQLKSIKGNNDAVTITLDEAARLPWFKSWEELITQNGAPDIAIVALPTRFHCSAVVTALESGCHVMVEKPFATSVDECKTMIAAAEKAGKILSVGYVVRCFAEYNAFVENIKAEERGAV